MNADSIDESSRVDGPAGKLRPDRKKAIVMIALLAVVGIAGGCLLLSRVLPSKARARVAGETPWQARRVRRAAPAPSSLSAMVGAVPEAPRDEKGLKDIPAPAVRGIVHRDIFAPNPVFFPPKGSGSASTIVTGSPATQPGKPQVDAQAIRAQAAVLALESTIVGDRPTAIINGSFVRVGDWINGFEITGITAGSCSLRRAGVAVVLEMKAIDSRSK